MARHAFHAEYLGSLPDMHKKCAMPSDFLIPGQGDPTDLSDHPDAGKRDRIEESSLCFELTN